MFLFLHAQEAVLHKYVLARTLVPNKEQCTYILYIRDSDGYIHTYYLAVHASRHVKQLGPEQGTVCTHN